MSILFTLCSMCVSASSCSGARWAAVDVAISLGRVYYFLYVSRESTRILVKVQEFGTHSSG